jgi:SNF2 family DNA or RNA helicase
MLYEEYLTKRKSYQEAGHLFLLERKHACLFYKPGKGKTYPCIDALRDVAESKKDCKVLVLSTADAIRNMWNAEIVPQNILPKNTVLMSFNSAIVENTKVNLLKIKWDVLIVDECHKVKSHNSKTSKLVYLLSKRTEYVWGLTGTPRGNNDIDIYCQFHNLCISEWGTINYTTFVNTCCDIEKKFFGGNIINNPIGINEKYKPGWDRQVAMYSQRVEYSEEDEMPMLDVNEVMLPYTPTKEYLLAEEGVIKVNDYESTMTKLAAIQKLHQAVNGFLYIPDENDDNKKIICRLHRNPKLDWLNKNLTLEPTVIVYRFEADVIDIENELTSRGHICTESVDDFKQGKANILLLQCARCESFNLQMCKRIIFYTLDYSYIKYNQMIHRVWRMGQKEDVEIVILLFGDTVETNIWNSVKNKEKLAQLFMSIKGE